MVRQERLVYTRNRAERTRELVLRPEFFSDAALQGLFEYHLSLKGMPSRTIKIFKDVTTLGQPSLFPNIDDRPTSKESIQVVDLPPAKLTMLQGATPEERKKFAADLARTAKSANEVVIFEERKAIA